MSRGICDWGNENPEDYGSPCDYAKRDKFSLCEVAMLAFCLSPKFLCIPEMPELIKMKSFRKSATLLTEITRAIERGDVKAAPLRN